MMGKNRIGVSFRCLMVAICLTAMAARAQEESDMLDLNAIIVKGELYIWNRFSDFFDILRCGVAGGPGIGAELAVTEYGQLGAYTTNAKGVDFPHFIPPLWLIQYYEKEPIFNDHAGRYSTVAYGPRRLVSSESDEGAYFPRDRWDVRAQLHLALIHLYASIKTEEIGDLAVGFVGWDIAEDDQQIDPIAVRRPADQLGRGLSNVLFGALELPFNILRVTEEEGDLPGVTKGVGLGLWRFICREVVGVVEVVTFPFGWQPIIYPEYVVQKTTDSTWRVYQPSFQRRY